MSEKSPRADQPELPGKAAAASEERKSQLSDAEKTAKIADEKEKSGAEPVD